MAPDHDHSANREQEPRDTDEVKLETNQETGPVSVNDDSMNTITDLGRTATPGELESRGITTREADDVEGGSSSSVYGERTGALSGSLGGMVDRGSTTGRLDADNSVDSMGDVAGRSTDGPGPSVDLEDSSL